MFEIVLKQSFHSFIIHASIHPSIHPVVKYFFKHVQSAQNHVKCSKYEWNGE